MVAPKIALAEMALPIENVKDVYTNPHIDRALNDVVKYMKMYGLHIIGNINGMRPSFETGSFFDVYHVSKDLGYTVVIERSLGAFRDTGGPRDDEPRNRYGPDTLRVTVASSGQEKSGLFLEQIVRSVEDVEAFQTVIKATP